MADGREKRAKRIEDLSTIDPGTIGAYALDYLADLKIRNYSPHTIRGTRVQLRLFLVWCERRGLTDPQLVTHQVLKSYQRHLYRWKKPNGTRLSSISQSDRLAGVKRLFTWMFEEGHLDENPGARIHLPKGERRLPRAILSAQEAEQVMAQPDLTTHLGLRDRAMLEILYSTGLRRGELEKLAVRDLDLAGGTVLVRCGKGKKDRLIPISERAAAWVKKYLNEARPHLVRGYDDGTLLLGHRGEPIQGQWMAKLVRDYVSSAGIEKQGSCHMLRHTMATLMLEGGADIRYLQSMLGHATLQSTEIYTHVAIRKLKEIHEKTHPGARLKRRKVDLDSTDGAPDA